MGRTLIREHLMAQDPLFLLVIVAVLIVAGILLLGVGSFGKGGDFNRRNANRIMRWRIIAQFVAVCLILIYVWFRGPAGG
jgi:preprotein translocase subunit SecF